MPPIRRRPLTPVRARPHQKGAILLQGPHQQLAAPKRHYLKNHGWTFEPEFTKYGAWLSPRTVRKIKRKLGQPKPSQLGKGPTHHSPFPGKESPGTEYIA